MLNQQQGNNLIKNWLEQKRLFAVSRIGIGGETLVSYEMETSGNFSERSMFYLKTIAGFYGDDVNHFVEEYIKGIVCADLQVVWDSTIISEPQKYLFNKYSQKSIKIKNRAIEPFYFNNPWSEALEGKKVLIVHPFEESITKQYEKNREKIFENKKILPKFDLETVKSPQSVADNKPHSSWKESLEITKEKINNKTFDVALLGCGAYGLPLVNHIKNNLQKTAIYIGGGLQIMFGIKGERWKQNDIVTSFYNEHWIHPSSEETPQNYKKVENGSYW